MKESRVQSSLVGSTGLSYDLCFGLAPALDSAFGIALLPICFLSFSSVPMPCSFHREWNVLSSFTGSGAILAECEEEDSVAVLIPRTKEQSLQPSIHQEFTDIDNVFVVGWRMIGPLVQTLAMPPFNDASNHAVSLRSIRRISIHNLIQGRPQFFSK